MIQQQEIQLDDGDIIDARHLNGIDENFYYTIDQVAELMGCSRSLVSQLCIRKDKGVNPDLRHFNIVASQTKYTALALSRKFNVSVPLICKLRYIGHLESTPLRHSHRIPGWSVIDYIRGNASMASHGFFLDSLSIGASVRIPGWSILQYISKNCSRL